jgi:hypothetical protein
MFGRMLSFRIIFTPTVAYSMSFQDSIYRVFGGVVQIRLIHSIDSN